MSELTLKKYIEQLQKLEKDGFGEYKMDKEPRVIICSEEKILRFIYGSKIVEEIAPKEGGC